MICTQSQLKLISARSALGNDAQKEGWIPQLCTLAASNSTDACCSYPQLLHMNILPDGALMLLKGGRLGEAAVRSAAAHSKRARDSRSIP